MLITTRFLRVINNFGGNMFSKRNILIISTLLLTVFTFIICFSALSRSAYSENDNEMITVVLDAGHGGIDGGVFGRTTGVAERELNLEVTKKLEKLLIAGGFNVVLTRSTDAGLYGVATKARKKKDMQKRKEIIENSKPDLVVSIHMNYYPVSSRRGGQVFYNKESENGKRLAECIQKGFNEISEYPKDYSILTGDYYILSCTEYPSVICECGFLSNAEDEKLLISEEFQEKISYSIFQGIVNYLSLSSIVFCD